MESRSLPLMALALWISIDVAHGQHFKKPPFLHQRLLELDVGFGGGALLFEPVQSIYMHTAFAYCMEDRIGIRAEFFYLVADPNFSGQLDQFSGLFLGGEFHFPAARFDWSLLLQPGVARCFLSDGTTDANPRIEPVLQTGLQAAYYVLPIAHVFLQASYVLGVYFQEGPSPYRLDELRIQGGLGLNIFVNRTPLFQRKHVKF